MKKLVTIMAVLAIATAANASLDFTVGGSVPAGDVVAAPSANLNIGVFSVKDDTTLTGAYYLEWTGPATFDISGGTNSVVPNTPGAESIIQVDTALIFIDMALPIVPIPALDGGQLINNLILHAENQGNVTLTFKNEAGDIMATQIVQVVPEPITVALLGLGGLFIRRKMA